MIISFANAKGGVAKTTSSVALGEALACEGKKTLIVDLDLQGHVKNFFKDLDTDKTTTPDVVFNGNSIKEAIQKTPIENLDVALSSTEMANADLRIPSDKMDVLDRVLAPVRKIYDYIILDLPPQMNKINTSAMIATEGMIIPIIPHELSLDGLKILIGHRNTVRKTHQVPVPILGILITLADRRGASVKAFIRSMREKYKDVIFETVIPINIDLADTVIVRTPIRAYAPASKGAQAYGTLAEEVIKRTNGK